MPAGLGSETRTLLHQHESHKLHIEFTVATGQTIRQGSPAKLNTDGTVSAWTNADNGTSAIIGYAVYGQTGGAKITLAVRGHMVVLAYANAAGNAGFGRLVDHYTNPSDATESYDRYGTATLTTMEGWMLDTAAAQNDLIRFLVRG